MQPDLPVRLSTQTPSHVSPPQPDPGSCVAPRNLAPPAEALAQDHADDRRSTQTQTGVVARPPATTAMRPQGPGGSRPTKPTMTVSYGQNAYSVQRDEEQPVSIPQTYAAVFALFEGKIAAGSPSETVTWKELNEAAVK